MTPSENRLVQELSMSRMTVNRALRELTEEGHLVRVSGVGTFVAKSKPQSNLLHITNIADEITARGHRYSCLVLMRRTWCGGKVVTYVRLVHPSSRYRLGSRLHVNGVYRDG